MTRNEFEVLLRQKLAGLPQEDLERSVSYFGEMLDEHMEAGETEEEAVAALGDIDTVVSDILTETPLPKLIREKVRPNRTLRAWEIVLLVLGSPIWLSLLLAAFAVMLSIYIVLWSVVICCYAAVAALVGGALGGIASTFLFGICNPAAGIFLFGCGIACAGLALLTLQLSNLAAKGAWRLGKKLLLDVKSLFVGKEKAE